MKYATWQIVVPIARPVITQNLTKRGVVRVKIAQEDVQNLNKSVCVCVFFSATFFLHRCSVFFLIFGGHQSFLWSH